MNAKIEYRGPLVAIHFSEPQCCLSWAVVNGGRVTSSEVAWYFLDHSEYPLLADPHAFLTHKLRHAELPNAVGLMTSRKRYGLCQATVEYDGLEAWCIATVGLSNALRVGDPPYVMPLAGTINLLCCVSCALTPAAQLEALSIATEARTAAVLEAEVPSSISGNPSTGTGTDCIVVAHPVGADGAVYAGKHTAIGHVIGAASYQAVKQAIAERFRLDTAGPGSK